MNLAQGMCWLVNNEGKTLKDGHGNQHRFIDGLFEARQDSDRNWGDLDLTNSNVIHIEFQEKEMSDSTLNDLMNRQEGFFRGQGVHKEDGNWYYSEGNTALRNTVGDEEFFDLDNWEF